MSGVGILLIAAAVGYWVVTLAYTQKKGRTKQLGLYVGWIIVILALSSASCKLYWKWSHGGPGYHGKKGVCCSYAAKAKGMPHHGGQK